MHIGLSIVCNTTCTHLRFFVFWDSLVPRPPLFFVRFAFSIIHGSGRMRKRGSPGDTYHVTDVLSGGHEVDVGSFEKCDLGIRLP